MRYIAGFPGLRPVLGASIAILIFFQLHIQLSATILNVNLADPFAMLAILYFVLAFLKTGKLPQWKFDQLSIFVLLFTLVLGLAFLIGAAKIGITQWALVARGIGWFVLIGYLLGGSLLIRGNEDKNRHIVILLMAGVASLIIFCDMTARLLIIYGWDLGFTPPANFRGFSQNRNAFAFQLSVILVLLIGHTKPAGTNSAQLLSPGYYSILMAILTAGILFTGSRSAIAIMACIYIFCFLTQPGIRKFLVHAILFSLLLWILVYLATMTNQYNIDQLKNTNVLVQSAFSNPASNGERLLSIEKGLELWRQSPVFGSGLGIFIEESPEWFDKRQVIHNTPLWIAAELGIIGILVVGWAVAKLLSFGLSNGIRKARPVQLSLILLLMITGAFGMFHEIFFQRIFWLAAGILLAIPSTEFRVRGNET